jgi:hypothetical protein
MSRHNGIRNSHFLRSRGGPPPGFRYKDESLMMPEEVQRKEEEDREQYERTKKKSRP